MIKPIARIAAAAAALLIAASAAAEAPAGYYSRLNGKKGAELKTAAMEIVKDFKLNGSYSTIYSNLKYTFQYTDLYPNSQRWYDMYSDIPLYAPSFSGLNREHSFPKSWWGGSTEVNAYVDLNHLYPSEAKANQAKSNYPLGEVDMNSSVYFNNGITKVGYAVTGQGGGARYVFEPADEYKGDFARTYFYMATVYQNYTWVKNYCYMLYPTGTYPTFNDWAIKLLLRWAAEDPVSEKELARNEAVYRQQNNRNPFIDLPDLAEYIWGDKKTLPYTVSSGTQPTGKAVLFAPVSEDLDMGQVAIGSNTVGKIYFHGENLVGNINMRLYNTAKPEDAKMFSVASTSIPAAWANRDEGYYLNVTYTPTALGQHEAKLVVMDGGISGSVVVTLRGECLEKPVLTACTATDATNIEADRYEANWTYPANEVIDYWVVTRTQYIGGVAQTPEEILAEEPGITITGFDKSDYESYSVQSSRLGYRSPMSNIVFVRHAGVEGIVDDDQMPLEVIGMDGSLRLRCPVPHTQCRVYDVAGRLVVELPEVENNTDIYLPAGVYLVTTRESRQPARAVVR